MNKHAFLSGYLWPSRSWRLVTPIAGDKAGRLEPVVIDETQVMIIIGGSKGGGTLLYGDSSYSFNTGGLKFGIVSIQSVHVTGKVYDLDDVKDFPGYLLTAGG